MVDFAPPVSRAEAGLFAALQKPEAPLPAAAFDYEAPGFCDREIDSTTIC